MADVTPGTTSNGTPAARSASASSPPRPKTNGSPPLSRTTTAWPVRPCSTSGASISSCVIVGRPGALPASTSRQPGGARASSASPASRSCTTTSARAHELGAAAR